jgi:hypothetical protein
MEKIMSDIDVGRQIPELEKQYKKILWEDFKSFKKSELLAELYNG